MSDTKGLDDTVVIGPVVSTKSKRTADAMKPAIPEPEKKASEHPPVAKMVIEAIGQLNTKGGSSLQAIKKFIGDNYQADLDKLSIYIRKFLRGAVEKGTLVQTTGKGASGSFKLASKQKPVKEVKEIKKVSAEKKPVVKKTKAVPAPGKLAPVPVEVDLEKTKAPAKKVAQKKVPAKKLDAAKQRPVSPTRKVPARGTLTQPMKSKSTDEAKPVDKKDVTKQKTVSAELIPSAKLR